MREELELHTQRLWRCGKWKEEQPGGAGTMNRRTAARSGERAPPLSLQPSHGGAFQWAMEQGKSSRVSSASAGRCPRTMEAQEVTAALQLLAGAPSRAFIATACALTGADWVTCWGLWLSRSSEAGTNPGKERGRERSGLGKTYLESPKVPLERSVRARFLPAVPSKLLWAAIQGNVFSFQAHGLLCQTKEFSATASFLGDTALSTPCCCLLLANTPRSESWATSSESATHKIPVQFHVFSLPFLFFSNHFSISDPLRGLYLCPSHN